MPIAAVTSAELNVEATASGTCEASPHREQRKQRQDECVLHRAYLMRNLLLSLTEVCCSSPL